ncbi:LysR family transcriptional regulator, partial [Undibacterium sp. 5I1]|nr:LysR family transcriptional regulator [Undibacterium sp. 5I1]
MESSMGFAQHRQVQRCGRLRVSMQNVFANVVLANLLAYFIATYPGISLELFLSGRRVDLI